LHLIFVIVAAPLPIIERFSPNLRPKATPAVIKLEPVSPFSADSAI